MTDEAKVEDNHQVQEEVKEEPKTEDKVVAYKNKYSSRRTFKLNFWGEEWKDCFIVFKSVPVREFRELAQAKLFAKSPVEVTDITLQFLRDHFINGTVFNS